MNKIGQKINAYKLHLYGKANKEIAEELDISVSTVGRWLQDIEIEQSIANKDSMEAAHHELRCMIPKALQVYDETLSDKHTQRDKIDVATKVLQTNSIVGKETMVQQTVIVTESDRQDKLRIGLDRFGVKMAGKTVRQAEQIGIDPTPPSEDTE